MADDTDVPISFTANIDSLQKGVDAGEILIESLTAKINDLNTALGTVGSAGTPKLLADLEQVKSELTTAQGLTAQLSAQMATLKVGGNSSQTIQSFISDTHRLSDEMSSASGSMSAFNKTLGMQGVSATETAISLKNEAAAAAAAADVTARGAIGIAQARGIQAKAENLASLGLTQGINTSSKAASSAKASFEAFVAGGVIPATSGMKNLNFATSGMIQEYVRMGRAIASGQFYRLPSELATSITRMGGLGSVTAATLGTFAGFAVAAAAIGYITIKAIEAQNALNKMRVEMDFYGVAVATDQLHSFSSELERTGDISATEASTIVSSMLKISDGAEELKALSLVTSEYAEVSGVKLPEATKLLTEAMSSEHLTLSQLQSIFPGVTEAARENFLTIQQLGDAHKTTAALIDLVNSEVEKSQPALAEQASGWISLGNDVRLAAGYFQDLTGIPISDYLEATIHLWNDVGDSVERAISAIRHYESELGIKTAADRVHDNLLAENTARIKGQVSATQQAADAVARAKESNEATITSAMKAGEAFDTEGKKAVELAAKIRQMKAALHTPGITGQETSTLSREITDAQRELDRAQKAPKTSEYENFVSQQDAMADVAKRGSATRIAADQAEADKARELFGTTSTEYYRAVGKLNDARRESAANAVSAARTAGANELAVVRDTISQIKTDETKSNAERLAEEVAVWAKEVSSTKLTAQQKLEADREYNAAKLALEKEQASNSAAIAKSDASTEIALSKLRIAQAREDTETEFRTHQISADQRLATLTTLVNQERDLNLQAVTDEEKSLEIGTAAYEEEENRKRIITQEALDQIAALRRQNLEDEKREDQERVSAWKAATNEIISSEHTLISDVVGGRKTMTQILGGLIDNFLTKELEADATYLTRHLLLSQTELAADKANDNAGLVWKMASELLKTNTVTAGEAARTSATAAGTATRTNIQLAASATENLGFLARVGKWVASELGLTAATTTGEATRTTIKAVAATTALTTSSATNVAMAESYAALAAVEAASSVAAIPYVGWALAGPTAASTYAELQPMAALAALDVGAWSVPHDMPAYIHKGEMVAPKNFAEGLRESGTLREGSNSSSVAQLTYAPHINAPQHKSLEQLLYHESSTMLKFLNDAMRNGELS